MHKFLAAKEQAKQGGVSIQELKYHLDAELFLNEYPWWDCRECTTHSSSKGCLLGAETGQKEAERLVCCDHMHGLPRLDLEADASTVQLVGYWTTREEIADLFHQVYTLKRLPRPPPCRPKQVWEVMRDILSSLKDHLRCRRGEQPGGSGELEPSSTHPSHHWDRASQRERQDTLGKQELT